MKEYSLWINICLDLGYPLIDNLIDMIFGLFEDYNLLRFVNGN